MSRLVVATLAAALSLSLVACATTADSADASTSGSSTAAAPSDSTSSSTESASSTTAPTTNTAPGCNADGARSVVGQTASAEVIEQARIAAGADSARTIKPGEAVTMEYITGRLNIDVDASNAITNVRCG